MKGKEWKRSEQDADSLRAGLSHEHVMVCSDGLTPRHAASPASEKSCGYQGQVLAIATPKRFPGDCRNPWRTILPAIVTPPCLETVDGLKTPSKPARVQHPRMPPLMQHTHRQAVQSFANCLLIDVAGCTCTHIPSMKSSAAFQASCWVCLFQVNALSTLSEVCLEARKHRPLADTRTLPVL